MQRSVDERAAHARFARAKAERERRLAAMDPADRARGAAHAATIARMMDDEDRPPAACRIDAAVPWVLTLDQRRARLFARLVLAERDLRALKNRTKGSIDHGGLR